MPLKSEPIFIIKPHEQYCQGGQPIPYYYKKEMEEILNG